MFKKLQNRRQHVEIIKHGFLEDVRVFTSHEALARALFFPLNSSIHCLDPVFCSRKEKDGERERKGGREEGRKDCETRRKNRPSFFPKVENTFFSINFQDDNITIYAISITYDYKQIILILHGLSDGSSSVVFLIQALKLQTTFLIFKSSSLQFTSLSPLPKSSFPSSVLISLTLC